MFYGEPISIPDTGGSMDPLYYGADFTKTVSVYMTFYYEKILVIIKKIMIISKNFS